MLLQAMINTHTTITNAMTILISHWAVDNHISINLLAHRRNSPPLISNDNVGSSQPLDENVQISAEINVSSLGATPDSGNVLATQASSDSLVYAAMLAASHDFMHRDYSTTSVKFTDTDSAKPNSLFLSTRLPINKSLPLNPNFGVTYRSYQTNNTKQETHRAGLKIQYRTHKPYHLETELGVEQDKREISATRTQPSHSCNLYLGYRIDW